MRLRQVALVSGALDQVTEALAAAFGLKVAYNDPHIHIYGLRNAVLPAGDGFLEVVEPVRDDASAARHLKRRGGDAGYMVILQVADAPAEEARAAAQEVRVVDRIDRPDYYAAHFHPADFGGMLVSFDQQRNAPDFLEPYGAWMPAGPDWQAARTAEVVGLDGIRLSTPDPDALARRWSALLDRPLDKADPHRLPLDRGTVRFDASTGGSPTLIEAIELKVRDPLACFARAEAAGLKVGDQGIQIGGVCFLPVANATATG